MAVALTYVDARQMEFVELERRFRRLTDVELEDVERFTYWVSASSTLQRVDKEPEMQVVLARRFKEVANGAYSVTREEEVAEAKHPDIRLDCGA